MKKFSFKNILTTTTGQFFIIGLLCIGYACEDEPAQLSGNILPPGERINGITYDEHILDTRNILRTANGNQIKTNNVDYGILGEFNDPKFGKTKADFVTNFTINGKAPSFTADSIIGKKDGDGKDIIHTEVNFKKFNNNNPDYPNDEWSVDSLVLNLQYQFNDWYGDMLSQQRIKVYGLNSKLGNPIDVHHNDYTVDQGVLLAEAVIHPNNEVPAKYKNTTNWSNLWKYPDSLRNQPIYLWNKSVVETAINDKDLPSNFTGHTTKTKNWSIKLKDEITKTFFDLKEDDLASREAFKNVFNGLYVTSELENKADEGWLTRILLTNGNASNLTLYFSRKYKYRKDQSTIADKTTQHNYKFPITTEEVRINRFAHTTPDNIKVDDANTDRLHIQGMAGSYMRLMFPEDILDWSNPEKENSIQDPNDPDADLSKPFNIAGNIELLMEIDSTTTDMSRYPIPESLSILWKNDKDELEVPTFVFTNNGQTSTRPVFGITSSNGSIGGGERDTELNNDGSRKYYYRFIMNADYFNHIMKDGGDDLDQKEFYLLPNNLRNSAYNIKRVILFSGAQANAKLIIDGKEVDKRMKLDIKYFKYKVR